MLRQFAAWDAAAFEAMTTFPLHRFDSPPIAYVPIRSATRERFVVAVEPDGRLSCVSPTIHAIHSVTHLLEGDAAVDDFSDDTSVCGIASHEAELCVVTHGAAQEEYVGHFLKAERGSLAAIGAAKLTPPDPSLFLCGVSHLGKGLCLVWSDASAQYYQPRRDAGGGLMLMRTFKLSDFDFGAMKRKAGTEEMRKVAGQLGVCSDLNVQGVVCVVGPRIGTNELKYVVLDVESGVVQGAGMVGDDIVGDAPIKMVPSMTERGEFRLFVGKEDRGVKRVKMVAMTLATRIGMKTVSRKRKLETEASVDEEHSSPERDPTLQPPKWMNLVATKKSGVADASVGIPRNILKRARRADSEINGVIPVLSLDRKISECVQKLQEAQKSQRRDPDLVSEAIGVMQEWKESEKVLLVDLGGMVAEYAGCCCDWPSLRTVLSSSHPECLASCPALPQALLDAGQFDLFVELIAGLKRLRSDEYSALLQGVLASSSDPQGAVLQVNALERLQSVASASLDAVDEVDELSVDAYTTLKWKVLAVAGFSMTEVLLHVLVATQMELCQLQRATEALSPKQLRFLMVYLDKWFTLLKDDDITPPQCIPDIECLKTIPSLKNVVDWISALLSGHMKTLIDDTTLHSVLKKFQNGLGRVKLDFRALILAEGLCEEMLRPRKSQEPGRMLPYQVEVIDLSFDNR